MPKASRPTLQCSSGVSQTSSPHRPSARTSSPARGSGTSWSRTATRRGVRRPVHHQATPWAGSSARRTNPPTQASSVGESAAKSISQASAHQGSLPGVRRCPSPGRAVAGNMLQWVRDGHRVDALVTTGDNVYDFGEPRLFEADLEAPYRALLASGRPLWATLGNHDEAAGHGAEQLAFLHLPALPFVK